MARQTPGRATAQATKPDLKPAPEITSIGVDGFPADTVMNTWDELHRYTLAMHPGKRIPIDFVQSVYGEYSADDAEDDVKRGELFAKYGRPAEDADSDDVVDETPKGSIREEFMRLGELLDEDTNKAFSHHTGTSKEDYEGSIVVIRRGFKANDKREKGKLSKALFGKPIAWDRYPQGHRTSKGNPHPKALPFGTNKVADFYPVQRNGKTVMQSHSQDWCDGTAYGRNISETLSVLDKQRRHIKNSGTDAAADYPPPSADAMKRVVDRWSYNGKGMCEADMNKLITVDTLYERMDARRKSFYSRTRMTFRFMANELEVPKVNGLEFSLVHANNWELLRTTKRPVVLQHKFGADSGDDSEPPDSVRLSPSAFANYDFDAARAKHKEGTSIIPLLRPTRGEKEDQGDRKISLTNPTLKDATDMSDALSTFLASVDNIEELRKHTQAKGIGNEFKIRFHELARRVARFDDDNCAAYAQRVKDRMLKEDIAKEQARETEAEAMARGHMHADDVAA